ncbi:MAG: NTP transferase domain-containing protein, partial [Polyangiales bacterium]
FAQGLSSSLRCGLRALGNGFDGAMVCLADMPRVEREHMQVLMSAFDREGGARICVPTAAGRRGNPVVWPAGYFDALAAIVGDTGGRVLLETHAAGVCYVPMPDDAVLCDVDTETDLEELEARRLSR